MRLSLRRNRPRNAPRQRRMPEEEASSSQATYSGNRTEQARNRQAASAPPKNAAKTLLFWLQRLGLLILMVAIVASIVNIFSLSTSTKVLPLHSQNGDKYLRPTSVYENAASQVLKSSLWNRNKITVDTNSVSRIMLQKFPELNSVSVTVPVLAHRPIVYIEPAHPVLILATNDGAFVVDSGGKALVKGSDPAALNQPSLPVLEDQSNIQIKPRQQALPKTQVDFIQTVVAQLAAKGYKVSSMTLPAGTSQLDVRLKEQPYFVKFNLQDTNAREQAGTFLATIAKLQSQKITPAQYVDVRVDGRAYYQ